MQIKTTACSRSAPVRPAAITTRGCGGAGALGPAGGHVNCDGHRAAVWGGSVKMKIIIIIIILHILILEREQHRLVASHSGIEPPGFGCSGWRSNPLGHTGKGRFHENLKMQRYHLIQQSPSWAHTQNWKTSCLHTILLYATVTSSIIHNTRLQGPSVQWRVFQPKKEGSSDTHTAACRPSRAPRPTQRG